MQIAVDRAKCDGFGFCEQAAPTLLRLDEDGELVILADEVSDGDRAAAESAVRSCPVGALRIIP